MNSNGGHQFEIFNGSLPKFSSLVVYIPLISGTLIFLGFINYDLYYKKFGIEIFNFLEISEFLFFFVDSIYLWIFFISLFLFQRYMIDIIVRGLNDKIDFDKEKKMEKDKRSKNEKKNKENKSSVSFSFLLKILRKGNFLTFIKYSFKYILLKIVDLLDFILKFLVFIMYPAAFIIFAESWNVNSLLNKIYSPIYFLVFSIFYFLITTTIVKEKIFNLREFEYKIVTVFIFIFLLFINIALYQNNEAAKVLDGEISNNISFFYEHEFYKTGDKLTLVGITKNYIFLRDSESEEINIYLKSDLKFVKISKNQDYLPF